MIFISILIIKNKLKIVKKGGFITRVHVASPRGQARAPAWRGGDTWRHIFIFTYMV